MSMRGTFWGLELSPHMTASAAPAPTPDVPRFISLRRSRISRSMPEGERRLLTDAGMGTGWTECEADRMRSDLRDAPSAALSSLCSFSTLTLIL